MAISNVLISYIFQNGQWSWGSVAYLGGAAIAIWLLLKFKAWHLKRKLNEAKAKQDWVEHVDILPYR
ncbi:MAG: hypothetical protein ACYTBP_15870 [Planctomycetota bacterium]|jgi:hypothetical protein